MISTPFRRTAALSVLALAAVAAADTTTVTVDFEDGPEGWVGPAGFGGSTYIDAVNGNPGANLRTEFNDFGIVFSNSTNPAFLPDFASLDEVTFSMDLKVESIADLIGETSRPWLIEIRDYDNAPAGYPWVSVWYLFDWVSQSDWQTWSVTILDPNAVELPDGWGGYGAEDPDTFEPVLPADRTFADVLAGADEIVYTTFQPGFFFTSNDYDLRLDNISITTVSGADPVLGDLNGDGLVDFADLLILLAAYGPCDGCPADFDGNGVVDFNDLLTLLAAWS